MQMKVVQQWYVMLYLTVLPQAAASLPTAREMAVAVTPATAATAAAAAAATAAAAALRNTNGIMQHGHLVPQLVFLESESPQMHRC